MGCEQGDKVRLLVSGRLGRSDTLSVLDHTRACDDCRSVMTEHARVNAAVARGDEAPRSGSSSCGAATAPAVRWLADDETWRPDGFRSPKQRGASRRLLILGAVISALLWGSRLLGSNDEGDSQLSWEQLTVAAALETGRPSVIEPAGAVATRPKALAVILPAGNARFTLHVTHAGSRVLSHEYGRRDDGVTFDDVRVPSRTGELPATEALVPFPEADALPLESGARYFLHLELPNGNESSATQLEID